MAVLVEAISVVVRCDAIAKKIKGGWSAFLRAVPNDSLCTDDELVRVGFMTPDDVRAFVHELERSGLIFEEDGVCVDLAVVDQQQGPTLEVSWLEFARLPLGGPDKRVSACWLFEGSRLPRVKGTYHSSLSMKFATPNGWKYEGSLSADFTFVETEDPDEKLKFLRHQDGVDVFLDSETGKESFVGRAVKRQPH